MSLDKYLASLPDDQLLAEVVDARQYRDAWLVAHDALQRELDRRGIPVPDETDALLDFIAALLLRNAQRGLTQDLAGAPGMA